MSLLGLDVVMGIHALEVDADVADFELEASVIHISFTLIKY